MLKCMKIKYTSLMKSALMVMFITLVSCAAWAQRTISGTITDADSDEPMVGATIVLSGTTKGTLTDIDGKYELSVPENATTVDVSYTGYATQRIALTASNNYDVKLKGGSSLDEVVVVGYGTLRAKEVSSAIVSVKNEDFNKGNISDPLQLLQGKVAGLSIAKPGGNPNQDFIVRLRGISSLSNVSPLIVVDGIQDLPLNSVDPNDIESIDVLKDGSASAIYGTRGSAGVILITTKRGRPGESKISYNAQVSTEALARTPAIMTAQEFLDNGGTEIKTLDASGNKITSRTDWYKEITRTGVSNFHNLSLSGGTTKTQYYASFNFRNVQGVQLKDGYKQYIGRVNVTQKALDDKLKITIDAGLQNRDVVFGVEQAFRYASTHNPTAPIFDINNTLNAGYHEISGFDDYNPSAIVNQSTQEANGRFVSLTGKAEYAITDNLSISTTINKNIFNATFGSYYSRFANFRGKNRTGLASVGNNVNTRNFFNTLLVYKANAGKLDYTITGGYEYLQRIFDNNGYTAGGFSTDAVGYKGISYATDLYAGGKASFRSFSGSDKLISFLGRVNLNWDDSYFFTGSLRSDGSSQFAKDKKTALFPAFSAAVALNKVLNISSFDNLKFRVGFGQTGALPSGSLLSTTNYSLNPTTGNARQLNNGNPDLTWEKKSETNIGLDFVMGRLSGSLDYFSRNISDLLYYFPNTPVGVFETDGYTANAGNLTVNGLEFSLGYQVLKAKDKNGLNWKTEFNIGTSNSKLGTIGTTAFTADKFSISNLGAPGLNSTYLIYVASNQPIGQIWTFRNAGVSKDPASLGSVLGFDKNDKPKLLKDLKDEDKVIAGSGLPTASIGFNNTFTKGNFDFNFFIRGAFGHSLVNEYRVFYENLNAGGSYNRIKTKFFDPTIKEAQMTDRFVEKADFIRLDNFTIGYTIPTPNSAFKNVRLFLSGNNILTLTGYTGVDPEVKYADEGVADDAADLRGFSDPLAPGIDRRTNYFSTRAFSFGINLGF
jgi:TonB-dependent starch-binding outer membrane protein SusC